MLPVHAALVHCWLLLLLLAAAWCCCQLRHQQHQSLLLRPCGSLLAVLLVLLLLLTAGFQAVRTVPPAPLEAPPSAGRFRREGVGYQEGVEYQSSAASSRRSSNRCT
jgi:hypothetical protein